MEPIDSVNTAKLTPMMRQYFEIKERSLGSIMFFRMGDFYEIFGNDAEKVAPILGIVLTSRPSGTSKKIPFCGVPHHSAKIHLLKLLKLGFKVAIVDQIENPENAKGIVKRDIVRIYTPGCIDEIEGLSSDSQNYLMASYECTQSRSWAVVVCETSTGELRLGRAENIEQVVEFVELFKPKEMLVRKFQNKLFKAKLGKFSAEHKLMLGDLPEQPLEDGVTQQETLGQLSFEKSTTSILGGRALISALFSYLKSLKAETNQFMSVKPLKEPDTLALSEIVIRDLEIFETARRRNLQGSLFHTINRTLSPMGARLLRWSLVRPLCKGKAIEQRHQAIHDMLSLGEETLQKLRTHLKGTPDLERIATRIQSGKVHPYELANARDALDKIEDIIQICMKIGDSFYNAMKNKLEKTTEAKQLLHKTICNAPLKIGTGDGVIRPGFNRRLDTVISLRKKGNQCIEDYAKGLRERTGISSLKIKTHKTFGLLIEVTKSNLSKVPDHFIRRQTMVNCERFITDELKDLEERISSAEDEAIKIESEIYIELLSDLSAHYLALITAAETIAMFDMLQSFADLAIKDGYSRPTLNDDSEISLKGSRHPVVEAIIGKNHYIANDIRIPKNQKQVLITGPNMAGKSTVMRQVAITAILVQAGCYAPSCEARIPVFDQIYTRVGASDDLAKGQSTFMVEMSEAAQILRFATERSLVILDEVGRGTSTEDGLAIASAILEDLALRIKCWTMFATHYHELTGLCSSINSLKAMQTEVLDSDGQITFTHRLITGSSGSSFGIEVAKLAGIPEKVISKAASYLESHDMGIAVRQKKTVDPKEHLIRNELENINLNKMSPLQALNTLARWQSDSLQPQTCTQQGLFDSLN